MFQRKEHGGLNLPDVQLRQASFKSKFLTIFQNITLCPSPFLAIPSWFTWLEEVLILDKIEYNRDRIILGVNNSQKCKKVICSWLKEVNMFWQFLPHLDNLLIKPSNLVKTLTCNGTPRKTFRSGLVTSSNEKSSKVFSNKGELVEENTKYLHKQLPKDSSCFHKKCNPFNVKIDYIHSLIVKHKFNVSKVQNTVVIPSNREIYSDYKPIYTPVQEIMLNLPIIKKNKKFHLQKSMCRIAITDLKFRIFNNILPRFTDNDHKNCILCNELLDSSLHLLFQCPFVLEEEIKAYTLLGFKKEKAIQFQKTRINNSFKSSFKRVPHSSLWIANWSLWKSITIFVNDKDNKDDIPKLFSNVFCCEEYRFLAKLIINFNNRKYLKEKDKIDNFTCFFDLIQLYRKDTFSISTKKKSRNLFNDHPT